MILLDTNVVSEIYRPRPSALVIEWLDAQRREELYMCAPVLAELGFGLELLDESDRKRRLRATIDRLKNDLYRDRILAFDVSAATEYARIAALRQKAGNVMEQMDCFIAAIALANGASLATRNTRHFANIGLDLINPFATRTKD